MNLKKSVPEEFVMGAGNKTELKEEFLAIYEDDQKDRQYAVSNRNLGKDENERLFKRIKELEKVTRVKVASILDNYGWLGTYDVGKEANEAIAMVLIHCDSLGMQEKFLPLLKRSFKKGKSKGVQYARLVDRMAVLKNKKQRYGSQIDFASGKAQLYKLFKPFRVDNRRKKVGMGPLRNYLKNRGIVWPPTE
jgi:hypothetical protein